jgi:chaperonin GroEL
VRSSRPKPGGRRARRARDAPTAERGPAAAARRRHPAAEDECAWGDARTGEHKDLVAAGIIDPTEVVRRALQGAASAAARPITTEAMAAERPEKKAPAGAPPGSGGMGNIDF